MICPKCKKAMKEEMLFTTVKYTCNCQDGWLTVEEIKEKLNPLERPVHLKFKDSKSDGSVFVGNIDYFNSCPQDRKFKFKMEMSKELQYAEKLYGYSIVND